MFSKSVDKKSVALWDMKVGKKKYKKEYQIVMN